MKQFVLSLLVLLSSGVCLAQTTQTNLPAALIKGAFHSKPLFDCSLASTRPIQYFSQFGCRVIDLIDSHGNIIGSYSFSGSSQVFALNVPGVPQPTSCAIKQLKKFTKPSFGKYGQLQFTFEVIDFKGVDHKGSVSASWSEYRLASWYGPVIVTSTVTLTQ